MSSSPQGGAAPAPSHTPRLVASWLVVGVPLAYGIVQTVRNILPLFGG